MITQAMSRIDALDERRFRRLLGFGLLAVVVLYLVTSPGTRTEADDGYGYANGIETVTLQDEVAPLHVLFLPVMQIGLAVARTLGLADRAYPVAVFVSAVFASAALLFMFQLLHRRLELSRTTALLGAATLGVTYGFWRFSGEAEVYAMALAVGLAFLYAALAPIEDSRRRWILMASFGTIAVFTHILFGLLVVIAVPLALVADRRTRVAAVFLVAVVPMLLVAFLATYAFGRQDDQGIVGFYSQGGSVAVSPGLVARAGVGAGQAVLSSGFLFSFEAFGDAVEDAIPDRGLEDERYFGARVSTPVAMLMTLTFLVALLAVGVAVAMAVKPVARAWRTPGVAALGAWLGAQTLYFLVRSGGADGPETWILAVPAAIGLVTYGLAHRAPPARVGGTTVAVLLFGVLLVHNGLGMALVQSDTRDRNVDKGEWLVANATDGDIVLTADGTLFSRYLEYQTDAEIRYLLFDVTEDTLDDVAELLDAGTQRVFATGDVFDIPSHIAGARPAEYDELVSFGDAIAPRFDLVAGDDFGGVWVFTG